MANPEILIFDDNSSLGNLLLHSLENAGYRVQVYQDGTRALSLVKEIHPRLVILDVMMPGLDGLTICKTLRDNPSFKNVRIIVSSGKSSGNVEKQALSLGADLFLQKPFNVQPFLEKVETLIGAPHIGAVEPAGQPVLVTVLGCRSAGRTSCVALQTGEMLIMLDAGSGLCHAEHLLEHRKELHVILTHYHPDHTEGLAFLKDRNIKISICGPHDANVTVQNIAQTHLYSHTPPKGQISLYTVVEGTFSLAAGVRLSAMYLNHPGTTLGLRLDACGKTIVYCPDNEIRLPRPGQVHDTEDKIKTFAREADLFIHDACYTPEDYQMRINEGHSAYPAVVDIAVDAGAKRLMLFHFDPAYTDKQINELEKAARAQAARQITALEIMAAREGLHFKI